MGYYINYSHPDLNKSTMQNGFSSLLFGKYHISLLYTTTKSYHITLPSIIQFHDRLYMASPEKRSVSSTFFIQLFQPLVWIMILIIYLAIMGFLLFYHHFHKLKINQYIESLFDIIGISTERILFSTFSLCFCILISTTLYYILELYFTTFLTTKLAMNTEFVVEKLEDFSYQSKYKICTPAYTYSQQMLSNDKRYKNILNGNECSMFRNHFTDRNYNLGLEVLCDNRYLTYILPAFVFENILKPYTG